MDLQEQVCWLLLAFESGLPLRTIHEIIAIWCIQQGRTLPEFFEASPQEWREVCHLQAESVQKLESAKEKQVGQTFFAEQLAHDSFHLLTVLDANYPKELTLALKPQQRPPVLFYAGDLQILERKTIAIIGSRNAGETSLDFTRAVAHYLAEQGANVISGYARGVDRAAFEGATSTDGYTTVVLPHGIRKLSGVQMRGLIPKIESGHVLLLSQFQPDAPWLVSRAMERNKVVTGLAQVVIVAESDTQGGTWAGAKVALQQQRSLYVRQSETAVGNTKLIEMGGQPLPWPTERLAEVLSPLLSEHTELAIAQRPSKMPTRSEQLSLFAPSDN